MKRLLTENYSKEEEEKLEQFLSLEEFVSAGPILPNIGYKVAIEILATANDKSKPKIDVILGYLEEHPEFREGNFPALIDKHVSDYLNEANAFKNESSSIRLANLSETDKEAIAILSGIIAGIENKSIVLDKENTNLHVDVRWEISKVYGTPQTIKYNLVSEILNYERATP